MKKYLLTIALALAANSATADTIAGVYIEARGTQLELEASGSYQNEDNSFDISAEKEIGTAIIAKFEHPIPLIPNLRIAYEEYNITGKTTGIEFNFGETVFDGNFNTTYDITEQTATLYYEFLDFDTATLDAGFSIKHFKVDLSFTNSTSNESDSLDALVPAVYLSAKTQLGFCR